MENKPTTESPLREALMSVQQQVVSVTKDAKNPFHKNKYATIEAVLETVKPVFNRFDLILTQAINMGQFGPFIHTLITHKVSGEKLESFTPVIVAKKDDPQSFFAGTTYSRRYAILSLLSLPVEDDDGETATGRSKPAQKHSKLFGPDVGTLAPQDDVLEGFDAEPSPSAIKTDKIKVMAVGKNGVYNTFAIKDELKDQGFKFDKDLKGWVKSIDKIEKGAMEDDGYNLKVVL